MRDQNPSEYATSNKCCFYVGPPRKQPWFDWPYWGTPNTIPIRRVVGPTSEALISTMINSMLGVNYTHLHTTTKMLSLISLGI